MFLFYFCQVFFVGNALPRVTDLFTFPHDFLTSPIKKLVCYANKHSLAKRKLARDP